MNDPYNNPSYGYSSQSRNPVSAAPRGIPSNNNAYGGGGGGGVQSSPSPVQGIARVDRSSAINEYVAKQKAAKQNAPLIRKVRRQRHTQNSGNNR